MTALTVQQVTDTGFTPSFVAATASDSAPIGSGHNTFLIYRNPTGSPVTVNVQVPGNTFFGAAHQAESVTVPATTGEKWIPLRKDHDGGGGLATITGGTGLNVAVVQVS